MLPSALQAISRLGPDARNGLSLACNGCSFHRLHSRVNVPGLLLRFPADRFRCPFHHRLRYRPAIRSAIGRLNALDALQLSRSTRTAASPASTPLQDCYIPPDQSVLPDLLQLGPPSDLARSPFAPRCRFLSLVAAADQRSRFATFFGGLLFLKPLGTFINMIPIRFFVKIFLCAFVPFSSASLEFCFDRFRGEWA
jgi:hypothetical protein